MTIGWKRKREKVINTQKMKKGKTMLKENASIHELIRKQKKKVLMEMKSYLH